MAHSKGNTGEDYEAAYQRLGSNSAVAREFGVTEKAVRMGRRRLKVRQGLDPGVNDALARTGISPDNARFGYRRVKDEDGSFNTVFWRMPESSQQEVLDRIREAFDDVRPADPIPTPANLNDDLCTMYPLFDVHMGMHAWGRETGGDDYDIRHAEADLRKSLAEVLALTPPAQSAILLIGGDFFHADDNSAQTPASKHSLDVDGRHFKVVDLGIRMVLRAVDAILAKHDNLTIRVMRGNHDEHSHMVLTFGLDGHYRDEPRVTVIKDPRDIFMHHFGRTAIFAHHGDKIDFHQLTLLLSDQFPQWSETRHRYAYTGHTHKDQVRDFGAIKWESLRAFCPPDAYGSRYASRRSMQALTFHRDRGLVLRAFDPVERAA